MCTCLLQSLKLGRANLTFRSVNNRFDIVGGLLYYMLVVRGRGEWGVWCVWVCGWVGWGVGGRQGPCVASSAAGTPHCCPACPLACVWPWIMCFCLLHC